MVAFTHRMYMLNVVELINIADNVIDGIRMIQLSTWTDLSHVLSMYRINSEIVYHGNPASRSELVGGLLL